MVETLKKWAERAVPLAALAAIIAFGLRQWPPSFWHNDAPATGSDMGAHFWPLQVLWNYGLPLGQVRVWSPANLGGEPLLVHYFPLPFFLMAAFALVMPLGRAFNLGTAIPVMILPISAYVAVLQLTRRRSAALFAAVAALLVLYNDGYKIWGGNALSDLAGQFAHLYASNFLLLGCGALAGELRAKKPPTWSVLCFSGVCVSHAYIMIGLPFFALAFWWCGPTAASPRARLVKTVLALSLGTVLSLWFLVPMVTNAPWTTPFAFRWSFTSVLDELLPPILYPLAIAAFLVPLIAGREGLRVLAFWLVPALGYLGYFFVFPKLGLVDVRALPQTQLFAALGIGAVVGVGVDRLPRLGKTALVALGAAGAIYLASNYVSQFKSWSAWNYGGWDSRAPFHEVEPLFKALRGGLDEPRILSEHANDVTGQTGTPYVFDMLPYFANRSATGSLYMQSTLLAGAMFRLQSEVSTEGSCPFPEMRCVGVSAVNAVRHMRLLGVGAMLVTTKAVVAQAAAEPALEETKVAGVWHLFALKTPPDLVAVLDAAPEVVPKAEWKARFWSWFETYGETKPFLVVDDGRLPAAGFAGLTAPAGSCHPRVFAGYNRIVVETDCPGKAHILRYAFHSSWRSDGGETPFIASPGFLGVVPKTGRIELRFGEDTSWRVASWASLLAALVVLVCWWDGRLKPADFRRLFSGRGRFRSAAARR